MSGIEKDESKALVTRLNILALDQTPLAGTLYRPGSATPTLPISVIIGSATGVRRHFYDAYARYLAENGFSVVTFDYRGVGDSCPENLRGYKACARQWGEDFEAVIDWTARHYPQNELAAVGHSIGGILLGTTRNVNLIGRIVLVGSQSGYWRLYKMPQKQAWALLWYVGAPVLTRLFGYFPARMLGFGENLPAGVIGEFGRWCRNPSYIVGCDQGAVKERFSQLRGPVLAYSVDDDTTAPLQTVEALLKWISNAPIKHRHVSPADVGRKKLGHFGFFRRDMCDSLWAETIDWLGRY